MKNIIYIEEEGVEVDSSDVNSLGDMTVSSISEIEKLGKESPVEPSLPLKNGVAVIMFTSGSTGLPKVCVLGCVFTLRCVLCIFTAIYPNVTYCAHTLREL